MRVLVTGATGIVGRALIPELLRAGVDVVAIGRGSNPYPSIRYYQGDIVRSNILSMVTEEVDQIIHLAANVNRCDSGDCFIDNAYGVYVVSQWAEKTGVGRILYASTTGIYDTASETGVATEQHPLRPVQLYTMTKYLGESTLGVSKVPSIIMRFTFLYGDTDDRSSIYAIIRSVFRGRPVFVRNEQRDCLHVKDATAAVLLALNYRGEQRVFNIGTGNLTSMEEIARLAMKHCGHKVQVQLKGQRSNLAINSALAQSELDWKPLISLDEGVREVIKTLGSLSS